MIILDALVALLCLALIAANNPVKVVVAKVRRRNRP
jgi:hypothetical protein